MNRIKELRKAKNVNQQHLADLLGVKISTISKYETEQIELGAQSIKILCEYFNTTSDYLLCISSTKSWETINLVAQKEQPENNNIQAIVDTSIFDLQSEKSQEIIREIINTTLKSLGVTN